MKILYTALVNEDNKPGYKIKVYSQCKAFENIGHECYLLILKEDGLCLYRFENKKTEIIKHYKIKGISKEIAKEQIACRKIFAGYIKKVTGEIMPDIVYIRRIIPLNPWIISTIKYIKRKGINIAYEYPTYPWKEELLLEKHYLIYLCDCFYYKRLIKMVDMVPYIGIYNGKNKKFIKIRNAVDTNCYRLKSHTNSKDTIDFIAVAHVKLYHGYDRIIKGLHDYYQNENIKDKKDIRLHIVGTVEKSLNLEKIAEGYGLQERVIFHGFKSGIELDELFDMADIGVNGLAYFRVMEMKKSDLSSLKSREYMARGLAFINCFKLDFQDDIEEKQDYIIDVEISEEPVPISKIIKQYDEISSKPQDIRNIAEKYLSWEIEMQKVIDFFEAGTKE